MSKNISDQRYEELLRAEAKLLALEAAGVDNWDGYDDAIDGLDDDEEGEDE